MVVFTLPSFPYVFKVIRDEIAPPKETDRETVKAKYLLVKQHDRVGRMADTHEFSKVALPRARFSAGLLAELLHPDTRKRLRDAAEVAERLAGLALDANAAICEVALHIG